MFLLIGSMWQENAKSEHAKAVREEDRHDNVPATARKGLSTQSSRTDNGPVPSWTLDEHRRECTGLTDTKHFENTALDSNNLVLYDRSRF